MSSSRPQTWPPKWPTSPYILRGERRTAFLGRKSVTVRPENVLHRTLTNASIELRSCHLSPLPQWTLECLRKIRRESPTQASCQANSPGSHLLSKQLLRKRDSHRQHVKHFSPLDTLQARQIFRPQRNASSFLLSSRGFLVTIQLASHRTNLIATAPRGYETDTGVTAGEAPELVSLSVARLPSSASPGQASVFSAFCWESCSGGGGGDRQ